MFSAICSLPLGRWLSVGLALALLLASGVGAETLRVLAWPGYADADLVKAFEKRTGSQVSVTFVDSDEVLWERVNRHQGQDVDVFAVNTAELQRYIQSALVAPIQTAAIPLTQSQLPRFRQVQTISGLVHEGQVFGIPYTYAEMGLIYDRQQLSTPPTSVRALWDPQFKGRVLLYNGSSHNVSLAALALGNANPFQLGAAQWPAAAQQLIALRRNAQAFYTLPEESVDLFKRKGSVLMLANYGSQQVQLLKKAGVDVGYAIPREGALAWLDTWAISRQTRQSPLAHAWINYMLEPAPSEALTTRQGLANTVSEPPYLRARDQLLWLQPVEDAHRRAQLWERIYAGDRLSRVLAP